MSSDEEPSKPVLPLARVKNLMKMNEPGKKVSGDAAAALQCQYPIFHHPSSWISPVLTERFLETLATGIQSSTKRRALKPADLYKFLLGNKRRFQFLSEPLHAASALQQLDVKLREQSEQRRKTRQSKQQSVRESKEDDVDEEKVPDAEPADENNASEDEINPTSESTDAPPARTQKQASSAASDSNQRSITSFFRPKTASSN